MSYSEIQFVEENYRQDKNLVLKVEQIKVPLFSGNYFGEQLPGREGKGTKKTTGN